MNGLRVAVLHITGSRPRNPKFQAELDALNDSVMAEIRAIGWVPELLACSDTLVTKVRSAVTDSDVVVLMGGEDIDPKFYDGPDQYEGQSVHDVLSDRMHIEVAQLCVELNKPFVGICRGLQIMNVACGGTLIQHLTTSGMHRGEAQGFGPFVRHPVRLTRLGASVFAESAGILDGEVVYSTHHQAIGRLGEHLEILALAPDGIIEAVQHASAPMVGVQWHPEHPDVMTRSVERLVKHVYRMR